MSYLDPKEQFLLDLLEKNPEMTMKEANVIIRDKYDTGVSPPVYSKVKKILTGASEKKSDVPETKIIPVAELSVSPETESNGHVPEDNINIPDAVADDFFSVPQASSPLPAHEVEAQNDLSAGDDHDFSTDATDEEQLPMEAAIPKRHCPVAFKTRIKSAQSVYLAGSFNAWKKDQYPMRKGENNWWFFEGELPEGEHHYKYVIDQLSWHLDFTQPFVTDDTGVSHKVTIS